MVKWGALLEYEAIAQDLLQAQSLENLDHCLFDPEKGFKPTGRGQTQFFTWFPLQEEKPEIPPPRWCAAIGGIGCLAGETEINGIPAKDLTQSPIKVQTLIGETWATPAYIKGQANLYRVTLRSGKSVIVTKEHKFLGETNWIKLQDLSIGSLIYCNDRGGEKYWEENYWDVIEAIKYVRYDDFYDLHVPIGNHYLANGIWHHNSGKTHSGAIWTILQSFWYADVCQGLIVSNSFQQLWKSTLVGLFKACVEYNIPVDPWHGSVELTAVKIANSQNRYFYLGENRMLWHVSSMSAYLGKSQTGRGAEFQRIWADEAAYAPESAFQVVDGRMRSSNGQKCQGIITTSPNGFNWLYYRFGDPARTEEIKNFYWMLNFLSLENTHLDESYVAGLKANYTDEMAQQELEGAFIDAASGKIYKYFSRNSHTLVGIDAEAIAYDPNLPLHIAFDFNAAPCVAVLAQKRANELHVFKEFFMLDADLWELIVDIRDFIKAGKPNNLDIHLYGDASGRAKSAVSKMSAWQIIFEELKPLGMQIHKHIPDANPPVRHRTHAVNLIFKNNRCFLAMDSVPELAKDLEQLSWDKDMGIDKTDSLRSHLSDAFGYMVYQIFVPKQIAHHSQRALPSII